MGSIKMFFSQSASAPACAAVPPREVNQHLNISAEMLKVLFTVLCVKRESQSQHKSNRINSRMWHDSG